MRQPRQCCHGPYCRGEVLSSSQPLPQPPIGVSFQTNLASGSFDVDVS